MEYLLATCKTFLVKIKYICIGIKNHLVNSFALILALNQWLGQLRNGLLTVIGLSDDAEYSRI